MKKIRRFLFSFVVLVAYIVFGYYSMTLISAITGIDDPFFVELIFFFIFAAVLYWVSRRADKKAEKKEEEERRKREEEEL